MSKLPHKKKKKGSSPIKTVLPVILLLLCVLLLIYVRLQDEPAPPDAAGELTPPPAGEEVPASPTLTPAPVFLRPSPDAAAQEQPEPSAEPERVYELPRLEIDGVAPIKVDEYSRSGVLTLYDVYGNIVYTDDAFSWRTHGNSTARFGKLPMKLKLSQKVDLLGMGSGRKYILLANAYDKTLIRNALAFDLGQELGLAYTSEYRYVDLYISGQYRGNYMLIEPVEPGGDRVDIHPAANEYLLEVFMGSYTPEKPSVETSLLGIRLEVDTDELDDGQRIWLDSFLTDAETALLSGERERIEEYFDLSSFVDTYIINELSKNSDTAFASTRFYIKGGKLYAGPLWDFDLSFGNGSEPCDWRHYINGTNPAPTDGWYAPVLWWREMVRQEWFLSLFSQRYLALQPVITNLYEDNELGKNRMDSLVAAMPNSIHANFNDLWPVHIRAYYGEMISKPTYEANLEYLREWIRLRNQWILSRISAGGRFIEIVETPEGEAAPSF